MAKTPLPKQKSSAKTIAKERQPSPNPISSGNPPSRTAKLVAIQKDYTVYRSSKK